MLYISLSLFFIIAILLLLILVFQFEVHYLLFSVLVLGLIYLICMVAKRKHLITNIICLSLVTIFSIFSGISVFNIDKAESENFVIHATGSEDGSRYLNSVESLDACIEKQHFLIEIDFMFSADGEVVCTHEFENIKGFSINNRPTYNQFKSSVITSKGKNYTPLTYDYLLGILKDNEDVKIVFDSKEKNVIPIIEKMLNQAESLSSSWEGVFDLRERLIIQVYSIEDYNNLQKYNFSEYWFTNYKANYTPSQISKLFGNKQNLTTIVLSYFTWELFSTIHFTTEKKIAVHTINNKNYINYLFNHGVDYIYTDII